MELELKKACFDAFEAAGELTLTQEETAETIVPDYCPDIARIIETTGKVFLHSREMRDGRAEISGTVRVTVLYTPEGEGGIRTLEFAMPFTVETDGRSLPDCAALLADTEPELLETRMLNPRKVFTHCKLVTRLTGYQRSPLCFCTDAEAGPELCIEKKQEQQHAIVLTHIAEKDFTFSEQMDLSPGREGAAEILTSRVNSTVTETKIVGSKLLFKGIFTVSLLYRTGGRPLLRRVRRAAVLSDPGGGRRPGGRRAIGAPPVHRRGSAGRRRRRRGPGDRGDAVPPRHSSAAPDPGTDAPQ